MPRPRQTVPSYLPHHNGQARMCWRDAAGNRRFKTLPGPFNSPESLAAYHRLCLELATSPAPVLRAVDPGPSVASAVLLPYLEFAKTYYGPSAELEAVKAVVTVVQALYGTEPAASFGPKALAAVRVAFVRKGWSRPYTNRQARRVVRMFKWASAEELAPVTVYQALKTLEPLRRGKTGAPEAAPRVAANPDDVRKVLPFLAPHTRAAVELIRLTGARPGEVCRLTLGEIDRANPAAWVYAPADHKLAHKGRHRAIVLGPAAQEVIVRHLDGKVLAPDEPLFSPARQRDERFERMRAKRKTKVQPSQVSRKKKTPKKVPGRWFTPMTLAHAVKRACEKAGVPTWTPYMLRHLKAAEVRQAFGIEHAKAVLGHSAVGMTDHYARHADLKLAAEVAERAG